MWNCLMIYCDWCLNNARMSISCAGRLCLILFFFPSPPVFLQRGHFESRRPSVERGRDAFEQREARRRFDHADAERPGSSVPD